jgi:hypothetical protein
VYGVEVLDDFLYVCVVWVKSCQDVIYIFPVVYDFVCVLGVLSVDVLCVVGKLRQ